MTGPADPSPKESSALLTALNREFRTSLRRYFARRARSDNDADDMVQEVFERLLKRPNLTQGEHIGAYVFETASSVFTDRMRYRKRRHADSHDAFEEDSHAGVDFSPEDVLIDRERLTKATAALMQLPERTRTIFVLRRLEGMRYLDIAARFGISVSAIERHMQRAVAHLTKYLDQQ